MAERIFQGIDTIIFRVSDINEALRWYQDVLALTLIVDDPIHRLAVLDTGSAVSLTLWETAEPVTVNSATAAYPIFRTLDVQAAHRHLKEHGISVGSVITDHAVSYCTFRDPDGNMLEVCQVHE